MKIYLNLAMMAALSVGLSGCITLKCPDGSIALDGAGNQVKINSWNEQSAAVDRYCPKQSDPLIDSTPPLENPPPGPAPTNLLPTAGLGAVGVAALGLPAGHHSASSTTGTR